VSLTTIIEAGAGTQWVDITTVADIDTAEYFTFSAGTIDGTSDLGVLNMFTATSAFPYAFNETSTTAGTLRVALPDDDDWTLVEVAAYVFNRAAGTLTFTDVEGLDTTTFGAGTTYAIDRTSALPSFADGVYSYTNGSGIEIAKEGADTENGAITVSGNAPADFSDTASLFADLANKAGVTVSWLGNTLYGEESGDTYALGTFTASGVSPTGFILHGHAYELREVPVALTGGGSGGIWRPKNDNGDDLAAAQTGTFMDIKFITGGTFSYDDTVSITGADVDPFTGVSVGTPSDFYVLDDIGNKWLYIDGVRFAKYAIETAKLTFEFVPGMGYGEYTYISPPNSDGVIAYFE
jgi:hypothetical protein